MQPLLHVDQLLGLALEQPLDGHARPARDDRCDVVLVDLLLDHRHAVEVGAILELLLELGQLAVADLGHALEVTGPLGPLGLDLQLVDLLLDLADALERLLLLRPAGGELVAARLRLGQLALDRLAHLLLLLLHRRQLDLELADTPLGLVELERRGVDLHAQPGGRLVDQVDRLVGELPVGDVAVGEHRSGDERRVPDRNSVVRLVALLQAAEDRDRVGD